LYNKYTTQAGESTWQKKIDKLIVAVFWIFFCGVLKMLVEPKHSQLTRASILPFRYFCIMAWNPEYAFKFCPVTISQKMPAFIQIGSLEIIWL